MHIYFFIYVFLKVRKKHIHKQHTQLQTQTLRYDASFNVPSIPSLGLPWVWQRSSTSWRSLYSARGKLSNRRVQQLDLCPFWIYKCSPLYSNLAWLHKTLLTHTYLSKHICRGHEMSRADSRPAPLPAYTEIRPWVSEEVNTCTWGIFTSSWLGSFNHYQRAP